ncbi:MAG: hypothetical protein QOF63_1755 [Thermoanaerobaculia bacterium]|nr:hypothetical protein [Thermoanaerobaculia bacterium]MEA2413656.1 hypothetical protein [Thermoanaerobaculia bacterium]
MALLAMVCAAVLRAQTADLQFADSTLDVIEATNLANLLPKGRHLNVVVIARPLSAQRARSVADLLQARAAVQHVRLHIEARSASITEGDASAYVKGASVVVVIDATPNVFFALEANRAMTISWRLQDIGKVAIVVQPPDLYRDDGHLRDADVSIDPQMKSQRVDAGDALNSYKIARSEALRERSNTDWWKIVINLRLAIARRDEEKGSFVSTGNGLVSGPYIPHFHLSEALARIGDCEGAIEELNHSSEAARVRENKNVVNTVIEAVTVKPCHMPWRAGTSKIAATEEGSWHSGSF